MKTEHIGKHPYRLHPNSGNPTERQFAKEWQEQNDHHNTLAWLMGNGAEIGIPTPEQIECAATAIQWLGSPVGMCFLRDILTNSPEALQYLGLKKDESK